MHLRIYCRSNSISRGLQVETEDLIQFSMGCGEANGLKMYPNNSESNNNVKRDHVAIRKQLQQKQLQEQQHSRLTKAPIEVAHPGAEGYDDMDEFNIGEFDEGDENSARTADEQMDYLESLEPCPCYAKCCIDSVVTLFCVTLLG